jgi:hypothetical protein
LLAGKAPQQISAFNIENRQYYTVAGPFHLVSSIRFQDGAARQGVQNNILKIEKQLQNKRVP